MSVKPRFETYRYVGEICRLRAQSVVECRLPGSEINSILAVYAKAVATENGCADGEVRYGGRVLLSIVYEDGEKNICRAERGAEFFHKADGKDVSPACFAKTALSAENVHWRREGSGLYVSVVVDADILVYGSKQTEYLTGGEDLICRNKEITVCKTVCVSGDTEGEDEFESDYVGDILLHSERAVAHRVEVAAGTLHIDGELLLNICVLKEDNTLCSYERLLPFHMEVPSDEAFGNASASARVCVKSARLTADVDEDKGKSKIVFSYCLAADCFLCVNESLTVVDDAFSPNVQIAFKKENGGGRYAMNTIKYTERINGVAALSPQIDEEYALQAAVLPRCEINLKKGERGMEAEGIVTADVLLCSGDGSHRSAELSLPFIFPVEIDEEIAEADCLVCGLNVRRKKGGEVEAEATLKLSVKTYKTVAWEYLSEVEIGEEIREEKSGFTVFIPRAGDGLWELAKRLRCHPENIEKSNPELQFPIQEGERIFVYRQIE